MLGAFVPPSELRAQRRQEVERERVESVTVGEWAEVWLAEMEANPKRSRSTVVSYRSVLRNHVLPTLGDVRLVDLTTQQVADLLTELRSRPSARHPGAKANGITHTTTIVLRSMINAAVKREVGGLTAFRFPDAVGHVRVRPAEEDGDVATPAEVAAMADAMPEHLRIAVPLAAWCALRLGEVLGLERRDLDHLDDPARATLHVRRQWNTKAHAITDPKADSARSIAIPRILEVQTIRTQWFWNVTQGFVTSPGAARRAADDWLDAQSCGYYTKDFFGVDIAGSATVAARRMSG